MQVINHVHNLPKLKGKVALVPTMGNLHAGHMALIHAAQQQAKQLIVSIFVNPLQFGENEDFSSYPRTFKQDKKILELAGVDILFVPASKDIYQPDLKKTTKVEVPGISDVLCGKSRPGHFVGVTTIVAKLFNMTRPDLAVFGMKDFQQLFIIRRMVQELNFPIELIAVPTVREVDDLALSSRNQYLSKKERIQAPLLYQSLLNARDNLRNGANVATIRKQAKKFLRKAGFNLEYLSIRDLQTFDKSRQKNNVAILVAAKLGKTRLIDNLILEQ